MLPKLPDWLSRLLLRLMLKVFPAEKIVGKLSSMSESEIYSYMQPQIEKYSDKDLDRAIKDIKEGNYYGLEDYVAQLEKAGLTRGLILQWLENEKFLREHRRKYHPELKGGLK